MSRSKPLSPESPPLSPLPPKPVALPLAWRFILTTVLFSYVLLGGVHIATTPVARDTRTNFINAPDEAAHLVYVRAMAEKGHMPVRHDKDYPTYEWHQPPLYYSLVSLAHGGGPRAVRWATLLLGVLGIWVIFLAARRIFPDDPALAVTAAGFAALLPMRQAITSAVGNDVLIELLFSATLLVIARGFHGGFTAARAITLGACIGMALATKATGILLMPVLLVSLLLFRKEGESWKNVLRGAGWVLFVAVLLPAGWYARNWRLYGEVTPVKSFMREFEQTKTADEFIGKRGFLADAWSGEMRPADNITRAQYLGLLANWTFRSFWAAYTPPGMAAEQGIPFFLPPAFYLAGTLILAPSIIGICALLINRRSLLTRSQNHVLLLCAITLLLVVGSFVAFTWTFFQAQGRYLYPAMLPISLLFAAGLRAVVSERYRDTACLACLSLMMLLCLAFLFAGVLPAYAPQA